jgi:hypothetical protein
VAFGDLFAPPNNDTCRQNKGQRWTYQQTQSRLTSSSFPQLYEEPVLLGTNALYDETALRRLLWQRTMAGGAGSLLGVGDGLTYPQQQAPSATLQTQLKAFDTFWRERRRFRLGMQPIPPGSPGEPMALVARNETNTRITHGIWYAEQTRQITLDLRQLVGSTSFVIAIDTASKDVYKEYGFCQTFAPGIVTLQLGRVSDWAVAVGQFRD